MMLCKAHRGFASMHGVLLWSRIDVYVSAARVLFWLLLLVTQILLVAIIFRIDVCVKHHHKHEKSATLLVTLLKAN